MRFLETVFAEKKIVLDALDKKILAALARNARSSHSAIAKDIHTSRDTVNYRITNLKKNGVLQGFRTLVNIAKFGYLNAHLFLQLRQPTKEIFAAFVKKLKDIPHVRAIIHFNGTYDLELALIAKDMNEYDKIIGEICSHCGNFLQYYELLFIRTIFSANTFPKSFIPYKIEPKIEQSPKKAKEKLHSDTLDNFDIKILELLAENADIPIYKIAQQIDLSADVITYRIKKLQKNNYILGYVPAINYALMQYHLHTILIQTTYLTHKEETALQEFIRTNNHILWAVKTVGSYHLLLYICTQKLDDVLKTTEELRNLLINKIISYELLINVEEYKYTYLPKGLFSYRNQLDITPSVPDSKAANRCLERRHQR